MEYLLRYGEDCICKEMGNKCNIHNEMYRSFWTVYTIKNYRYQLITREIETKNSFLNEIWYRVEELTIQWRSTNESLLTVRNKVRREEAESFAWYTIPVTFSWKAISYPLRPMQNWSSKWKNRRCIPCHPSCDPRRPMVVINIRTGSSCSIYPRENTTCLASEERVFQICNYLFVVFFT